MNMRQVSAISLAPELVDGIVFWSKNPKPMINSLHLLDEYSYYFQFTLNPYDNDVEPNLPFKNEIIETFKKLSDSIGPHRIIWRYDPILLNANHTIGYHIDKFGEYAGILKGYTEKVTFSFIDIYKKIAEKIKSMDIRELTIEEKNDIAKNFSKIAMNNNLVIDTCAEDIDLSKYGIWHGRCIDTDLIAKIAGCDICIEKDKNQRPECGCAKSIDIGEYDSCSNGCVYCYANNSNNIVDKNTKRHNSASPLLIGAVGPDDSITERKIKSDKVIQNELF
jgi:DNA repair photolyase